MLVNELLGSVVEITRHRDRDSLEFSLVATLAELIPVIAISLYRTINEIGIESLEDVVHLDAVKNANGDLEYLWQKAPHIIQTDGAIRKCWQGKLLLIRAGSEKNIYKMYVPILKNGDVIGILMLSSGQSLEPFRTIVEGFVKIYENYLYILSAGECDTLTGLLNRRSFDGRLSRLLELQQLKVTGCKSAKERRAEAGVASACLVVVDVDHFKRVNDTYGHMYGDEVLLLLSQIMRKAFRQADLLFRFGGDEFVIILSPIKDENTPVVLERFRQQVADFSFPQVGQVTISIGYAEIRKNDYPPDVLDKADKALYYAKSSGRNQIRAYEVLVANGNLAEQVVAHDVELF